MPRIFFERVKEGAGLGQVRVMKSLVQSIFITLSHYFFPFVTRRIFLPAFFVLASLRPFVLHSSPSSSLPPPPVLCPLAAAAGVSGVPPEDPLLTHHRPIILKVQCDTKFSPPLAQTGNAGKLISEAEAEKKCIKNILRNDPEVLY